MHPTNARLLNNRLLFIISGYERRDRGVFTVLVHCHVDYVTTGDVAFFARYYVFCNYLNANLHARASNIMHVTVDRDNISNKSRSQKIKSLHPGSDHSGTLAVLEGYDGCRLVNHTHNNTSMHIALCICILQSHHPPGSTARVGNASSLRQIDFRKSLISLNYSLEGVHGVFTSQTGYLLHDDTLI